MQNMVRKWRELAPLFVRTTANAPLIFTFAPPGRVPPFSVQWRLKWRKCPALLIWFNQESGELLAQSTCRAEFRSLYQVSGERS